MPHRAKRSSFDNDGFTTPPWQENFPMTLTYALIADGGIVLAADSEAIHSHFAGDCGDSRLVATYREKKSKIRVLPNGVAFSFAGNSGLVDELLAKAELGENGNWKSFDETTEHYRDIFQFEYEKKYKDDNGIRPHCEFLLCGYSGHNGRKIPKIIKLSSYSWFSWNPVATHTGFGFSGRENHGGILYLHHRLYSPLMQLGSAQCLAYCALKEVAELDNIVGEPIEVVIIKEDGVERVRDFAPFEQKRQELIKALGSLIDGPTGPPGRPT
jgi:hypothetical protein